MMTRHTKNFQLSSFNFQLIIVLASTMLTSCVNDIPYDAEIGSPKLVLNAMLRTDSVLTATVSRTVHFLDTEAPQRLSDATVTAIVNGEEFALAYDAATRQYVSHYSLNAGDEVTLTAVHTLGTATATQRVMPPTAISIASITMQPFTNPGDPVSLAMLNDVDSAQLISLHIADPAEETNYYRLTIDYEGSYEVIYPVDIYTEPLSTPSSEGEGVCRHRGVQTAPVVETFYPHYLFTESSSRLLIDSESAGLLFGSLLYMSSTNSFIFTDEHLRDADGEPVIDFLMLMESPTKSDNMYNPESGWQDYDIWPGDHIFPADTVSSATYHYTFTLESLSEDYYKYLNDVAAFEMTGGALISEPLPIHTNIRGGLGIVGSYSTTERNGERRYCVANKK